MDKKNKDKKMINITNIVRNYLEHNIGMQNVLRARVEHFIDLFGRVPTVEECEKILKSAVICEYARLFEDTVLEAKEQGRHYPTEYTAYTLQDIALTDWEHLIPLVLRVVKDVHQNQVPIKINVDTY